MIPKGRNTEKGRNGDSRAVPFNTAAYEFILSSSQFLTALWVSVRRAVLGVSLNMLLIILTAFPLSKSPKDFHLRPVFSWIFVITMLFDGGLIPNYMIVRYTGLIIYNQDWWWNNRNSMEKSDKPELYEAVMANMVEDPEQIQCEDDQVQLAIQDVSWAPEADIMTISFRATPKHSDQDELHSIWALDTDGSYIGEGGSVTITDDSEDRAMHWLWRTDIGLEGSGGYGHIPGYGPVSDMMDDSSMHLLLLDYTGTNIIINSDEVENAVEMFPMESSIDMFRTTAGDVYFVGKFDLSWLKEEYDQEMQKRAAETPDMKDYYDQRISIAQAARERIGKEGIT
ncbi:MAG: hypothetical protein IKE24_03900 [Clostridia bacterium]|nr:hypothetical protein [Clostridia bacterium]